MGVTASKFDFKERLVRLKDPSPITIDDACWAGFWQLPESPADVYALWTNREIRETRDHAIDNLETLIIVLHDHLVSLRNSPNFPNADTHPDSGALNCVRVLSRILPFIYEKASLETWERELFWTAPKSRTTSNPTTHGQNVIFDGQESGQNEAKQIKNDRPLGHTLIDTLIDLLFYRGFTLAPSNRLTRSKVDFSIWTSGIGQSEDVPNNARLERNRTEILRLLLTLASKTMYLPPDMATTSGTEVLTYLATSPDKSVTLALLCSLLNTTMKSTSSHWSLPLDTVTGPDVRNLYSSTCVQMLNLLVVYLVPAQTEGELPKNAKNWYRHYLSRIHIEKDFDFMYTGLRKFHQAPNAASYLPGSDRNVRPTGESMMLFWELLQCNKKFRSFITDTERIFDCITWLLSYALEYKDEASKLGIVRLSIFILQFLSSERNVAPRINEPVLKPDSLPASIRLAGWSGSHADLLIISLHRLLTTTKNRFITLWPAILAIVNNVAPYVERLQPTTCARLMNLFLMMSEPSFLLAAQNNHTYLISVMTAINAVLEYKMDDNPALVDALFRNREKFEGLRSFTLDSVQEDVMRRDMHRKDSGQLARTTSRQSLSTNLEAFSIGEDEGDSPTEEQSALVQSPSSSTHGSSHRGSFEFPNTLQGMSEKARGKQPIFSPTLRGPGVAPRRLDSYVSLSGRDSDWSPSNEWISLWVHQLPLHTILTVLSHDRTDLGFDDTRSTRSAGKRVPINLDQSPIQPINFEWNTMLLNWYLAYLWSLICASEMAATPGANMGIWNGTAIRLFKVEAVESTGPSLMQPRGAVDAVGQGIVDRLGSLARGRLGGGST